MSRFIRYAVVLLAGLLAASAAHAQEYALDAPDSAHIRQSIEVGWTAPEDSGGLIEIRPADGGSRLAYAYTLANPQSILAPELPGDYEIVLIFENEDRASAPLSLFLPEATLEAPAQIAAGADFEVAWTGPNSRNDHVTIAERDGPTIRGSSYAYVGNTGGGPAGLRAPLDAGDYDVVYVTGETILARAPITVGAISASLSHASQVHAGGELRVVWEGPRNGQDYITFAARDGEPVTGASYGYVANQEDNAIVLRAPETVGPLDVVYVVGDRVVGRSPVDVVEASIDLSAPDEVTALEEFFATWDGAGNRGDWIGVVDGDDESLAYAYIVPDELETRLVAPPTDGDFHLVYLSREGREMARRPIRVAPAPEPPGTLLVEQARVVLEPEDAVGVIFDASGSMLQRIDGVRRVEIARQTLGNLVTDTIPPGVGFSLRVFGHRESGSCRTDLELPLGPLDPAAASTAINGVEAMNLARTPLGASIDLAASDLAHVEGKRLLIVLTDGEETCEGDAAAAIESLRASGWDITVNIVGFAIDDAALQAEFAAWAELGGGAYFSAADAAELADALTRAVATSFTVRNADGEAVAEGRPGELIALPAGDYVVEWGADQSVPAVVAPGGATTVSLE
ncbi:MAG: VWA domain-containing protein [Maricaulaceae bacterium]